jgi:hypothetical protein
MKYALCLRGINYNSNYLHDGKRGITPYTIDFSDCLPYLYKNIITPLEKNGHIVDIFFVTYDTPKLKQFINILNPKKVLINNFDPSLTSYAWKNIYNLFIDSLKTIETYSIDNNITYDFTILCRFDSLCIENITNVFLEPDGVSFPAPRDDCFWVIGKNLNQKILKLMEHMKNNTNLITHECSKFFSENGIKCHAMYGSDIIGEHYPFSRISRQHFVPPGHIYFTAHINDVFDPSAKFYGFAHLPKTEFCPCHSESSRSS